MGFCAAAALAGVGGAGVSIVALFVAGAGCAHAHLAYAFDIARLRAHGAILVGRRTCSIDTGAGGAGRVVFTKKLGAGAGSLLASITEGAGVVVITGRGVVRRVAAEPVVAGVCGAGVSVVAVCVKRAGLAVPLKAVTGGSVVVAGGVVFFWGVGALFYIACARANFARWSGGAACVFVALVEAVFVAVLAGDVVEGVGAQPGVRVARPRVGKVQGVVGLVAVGRGAIVALDFVVDTEVVSALDRLAGWGGVAVRNFFAAGGFEGGACAFYAEATVALVVSGALWRGVFSLVYVWEVFWSLGEILGEVFWSLGVFGLIGGVVEVFVRVIDLVCNAVRVDACLA